MSKPTLPKAKVEPAEPIPEVQPFTKAAQVKGRKGKAKIADAEAPEPTASTPAPVPEIELGITFTDPKSIPLEPYPDITTQLKAIEPITLLRIVREIDRLRDILDEHSSAIRDIRCELSRKRKPVPNGKVQIKDTTTGILYPSKNGTFKALLNSGQLDDLVAQGIFGPDPKKNTFAWYALNRAFPGRFEEIKAEAPEQQA